MVKRDFHSFYTENDEKEIKTIKRCNQYIGAYTDHSLFLDMVNYLAPGYTYLVKRDFHSFYTENDEKEIKTIKRCNQYIAAYTDHSLFLDMVNYLAPGYTYANYPKAFTMDECKGFFPYEWMTSTRKLSNVRLPPRSAFYSSLTGTNTSKEQYESCLLVWKEQKMQTFRDYLIYYNNKDVAPFVKAINEHMKFFMAKNIDMFTDGMTLPGHTKR